MKVAVIHDWLGPMTGAERVLDHILRCYPGADVYTTLDALPPQHRALLGSSRVTTSFIQHLPRAGTAYWNYIPLMPLAVERFDLSAYDLVISNSHTIAKGVKTGRHQTHVCYLETPMRFAWDLEQYYLERFRLSAPRRALARGVFRWMRQWDLRSVPHIAAFASVSAFVARRCEHLYHRASEVVYPPVDVDYFTPAGDRNDFYLAASRLTPFKRLDLIVEAFAALPHRRLVVIGDGPERDRIRAMATPNVSLLGYQPDDVLRDHMRRARAFLFAAPEDFGMIMAEAQACGTPVIALGVGGACEIVRGLDHPEPTGVLFGDGTPASVVDAVHQFEAEQSRMSAAACRANALRFTPAAFQRGLTRVVAAAMSAATPAAATVA